MPNANTTSTRDQIIAKTTQQGALKPFPANALKVIQISQSPECQVQEIVDLIELEPAMAVRVLAVANSPIYGYSRQITSISHAIVVLGIRNVTQLVASFATDDMYTSNSGNTSLCRELYGHALGCALVARSLTEFQEHCDGSTAFLLGLLHDIGKLLLIQAIPDDYTAIVGPTELHNVVELEKQHFDLTHEEIGEQCARNWGFPDEIVQVIAGHHGSSGAPLQSPLAQIVEAANWISVVLGVGSKPSGAGEFEYCEWNSLLAEVKHEQRLSIADDARSELELLLASQ